MEIIKSELINFYNRQISEIDKDIHRLTAKRDYFEDEIIKLMEK